LSIGENQFDSLVMIKFLLLTSAFIVQCVTLKVCAAASGDLPAQQLEATYLLNFLKFANWVDSQPPTHTSICFWKANPLGSGVEAFSKAKVGGRYLIPIVIQTESELPLCAMVYFSEEGGRPPSRFDDLVAEYRFLTVSHDIEGVAITLFKHGPYLRFNIDRSVASKAGIDLSSNLLRLAVHVSPTKEEEGDE
jgi:hypothetical protein